MVDEKKRPEVELDLDDVKETTIQLDEKKEEKKEPNLNLGEVDLGYASHDGKKEKVDIDVIEKEEPKETVKAEKIAETEDLNTYSEGIQKRIDKLTRKMREAERRERAALDYAQGLQKKYNDTQKKFQEIDESYVKQYDARIDAEKDAVKKKLKEAIETQNPEAIIAANEELSRLIVEKERARLSLAAKEKQKKEEREKFLMERELKRKQELESRFEGEVGVIRSRFDDSDEEDSNDESTTERHTKHAVSNILSSTQTLEDMVCFVLYEYCAMP